MSRHVCDRKEELAESWKEFAYKLEGDLRAEIKRLTDIIVEMRRDGFQPPAPHLEQMDLGPELTDEIAAAIQARSVTDEIARHLRVFAAQQLRANVEPKRIADAIWNGSDYDEDA